MVVFGPIHRDKSRSDLCCRLHSRPRWMLSQVVRCSQKTMAKCSFPPFHHFIRCRPSTDIGISGGEASVRALTYIIQVLVSSNGLDILNCLNMLNRPSGISYDKAISQRVSLTRKLWERKALLRASSALGLSITYCKHC